VYDKILLVGAVVCFFININPFMFMKGVFQMNKIKTSLVITLILVFTFSLSGCEKAIDDDIPTVNKDLPNTPTQEVDTESPVITVPNVIEYTFSFPEDRIIITDNVDNSVIPKLDFLSSSTESYRILRITAEDSSNNITTKEVLVIRKHSNPWGRYFDREPDEILNFFKLLAISEEGYDFPISSDHHEIIPQNGATIPIGTSFALDVKELLVIEHLLNFSDVYSLDENEDNYISLFKDGNELTEYRTYFADLNQDKKHLNLSNDRIQLFESLQLDPGSYTIKITVSLRKIYSGPLWQISDKFLDSFEIDYTFIVATPEISIIK